MDIQEIKNFAKNKIESDDLVKQVRRRVKETAWEKQNQREGFRESFKPLISQLEKPEDPQTKNIFTQIQELLKNQRVFTEEAINKNKAIKKLAEQYERLADIKELPDLDYWVPMPTDDNGEPLDSDWVPVPKPSGNLEKNFVGSELIFLQNYDYPRPSEFNETSTQDLEQKLTKLNENIRVLNGQILGKKSTKNPSPEYVAGTNKLKESVGIQEKYRNTMNSYFNSFNYKVGKGRGQGIYYYNSPQELLKRLELLGGSLAAGNNGVLSEYIQIAHQLRDLGVVTNNQLNALLRKYINIR